MDQLSPAEGFIGVPNSIPTSSRLAIPPVSANVKVNVPEEPDPELGETETLLGTGSAVVQVPNSSSRKWRHPCRWPSRRRS